jgi:hypothetical protein
MKDERSFEEKQAAYVRLQIADNDMKKNGDDLIPKDCRSGHMTSFRRRERSAIHGFKRYLRASLASEERQGIA